MVIETSTLHLLCLRFDITRLLARGRLEKLPLHDVDLGYLVHCQLVALFGDQAPKPFALQGVRGRWVDLLAYGETTPDKLHDIARSSAESSVYQACSWDSLNGKAMPERWRTSSRLAFQLRACPVVRMDKEDPRHRKGAEVDAFLARCWAVGSDSHVDRTTVYHEWLQGHFERRGAGKILRVELRSFHRQRLLRRTQGSQRIARACERPDTLFHGTLEVGDPAAFEGLLRRGIGRHRAFGFGMLLLRPLEPERC